jgi:hypothetical protein
MRIHRQYGPSGLPAGRQDHTPDTPARHLHWRLRWHLRWRSGRGNAQPAPGTDTASGHPAAVPSAPGDIEVVRPAPSESAAAPSAVVPSAPGQSVTAAMQMAVGLLTASLDSPELEAWAVDELAPQDADGLGDLMAGLHVVSLVLLHELEEETGELPASVLQRLAIMAERRRGTPSGE